MNLESNNTKVFWQPDDLWRPDDHIPFGGDFSNFKYEEATDQIDTIAMQYYPSMYSLEVYKTMEIAIANPPNNIKEVQAGDKGIIIADIGEKTYHAKATVTSVYGQHWGEDYRDDYFVNYHFEIESFQIGSITYLVVRVELGDGTYAQLLMTSKEREMWDADTYRERRLREDAR